MRIYKIEIFRVIGTKADPNVDQLLHTGTVTEETAGDNYTATIPIPEGNSLIYSRVTDGAGNVSRISDLRSVNRNG